MAETPPPVGLDVLMEIQRFAADEAELLDRRQYAAWFELLTPDISYRVTTHLLRRREDAAEPYEIIDDDRDSLWLRVAQLDDPKLTLAENPPSFYRRYVTNLRADETDTPGTYSVRTNLLVYKNRPGSGAPELYAGERADTLRRVDGRLLIAARTVRLDQSVLRGGILSTLL